jgi:serine/threonine-protein kinase
MPFCAFFLGYYSLYYWWPIASVTTPSVIGLPLADACVLLSQLQLAPRILEEKVHQDIPPGTVLHQVPQPGTSVKPHQTIGLVLAQTPPNQKAPDYRMMPQKAIEDDAHAKGIKYKVYYVLSSYPQELCIGQWPMPAMPLPDHRIILYFARSTPDPVIVPDMRGLTVQEGRELCLRYGLSEPMVHTTNALMTPDDTILDQRPLPGSIMLLTAISCTFLYSA